MIGTKRLLGNCESTLGERFSLGVATLSQVYGRQIAQGSCDLGIVGAKNFLLKYESTIK
jgi:hypothetical protein